MPEVTVYQIEERIRGYYSTIEHIKKEIKGCEDFLEKERDLAETFLKSKGLIKEQTLEQRMAILEKKVAKLEDPGPSEYCRGVCGLGPSSSDEEDDEYPHSHFKTRVQLL